MKSIFCAVAAFAVVAGSPAFAQAGHAHPQGENNHAQAGNTHAGWGRDQGNRHSWKRGERMGYNDWHGAPAVDYRRYHLRQPPRGYEWRQQNNQFILVAAATGLIAAIAAASH